MNHYQHREAIIRKIISAYRRILRLRKKLASRNLTERVRFEVSAIEKAYGVVLLDSFNSLPEVNWSGTNELAEAFSSKLIAKPRRRKYMKNQKSMI